MNTALKKFERHLFQYFKAEKTNAIYMMGIGMVSILSSIFFTLIWSGLFWKGLALSLSLIGLMQLCLGFIFFLRNGSQVEKLKGALAYTPQKVILEESLRMKKLSKNLTILRNLETGFVFIGMILCFLWMSNFLGEFSFGTGVGLIIQSALLLVIHILGEWRADIYAHHLHQVSDRF